MPKRTARRPGPSARSLHVSEGFRTFVLDQLEALEGVTARSMFGGVGLYCRGVFFGILARDLLYLKTDATTRVDYEAARMPAFRPYPDRPGTMPYYQVPLAVLESAPDLVAWARKSVAIAARPVRRRRRVRTGGG